MPIIETEGTIAVNVTATTTIEQPNAFTIPLMANVVDANMSIFH